MQVNVKAQFTLFIALCYPFTAFAVDENAVLKVTPLLKTTTSWDGKPIIYPKGQSEVTALIVEIAPEGETGWHEHPAPAFGYIMEGELELKLATGEVKILHQGDVVPETVGVLHNGRNIGDEPVKILAFFMGEIGSKLSVAHPEFVPPPLPDKE
ncbi:MAG TPA: cupin domain-containing protein [Methylobacter sp.]